MTISQSFLGISSGWTWNEDLFWSTLLWEVQWLSKVQLSQRRSLNFRLEICWHYDIVVDISGTAVPVSRLKWLENGSSDLTKQNYWIRISWKKVLLILKDAMLYQLELLTCWAMFVQLHLPVRTLNIVAFMLLMRHNYLFESKVTYPGNLWWSYELAFVTHII